MGRLRTGKVEISDLVTHRLSLYLRCLEELEQGGLSTISSQTLADRFQLSSAQIRKDLAAFGEFGVRGVGYSVPELRSRLIRILGLDRELRVVIIGAGNLGQALADYRGLSRGGFRVVALFDRDPEKVGTVSRGGLPILPLARLGETARQEEVQIAVLAVPAGQAQEVLEAVAAAGIPGALNFAPTQLRVPESMRLRNVDLKIQLEILAFHLARGRPAGEAAPRNRSAR